MDDSPILLTVHGIRTFGQWQERLGALVSRANPRIRTEHYHYGYFSVLAFLVPFFRWRATQNFRKSLIALRLRYPNSPISIVAHSFGTHLVAWGLYGIPAAERPRIDTIVLCGSVLRSSFPWGTLLDQRVARQIVNDCGIQDNVLILSQFLVLLTGMAGRLGFSGLTSSRFQNRFFTGGHSLYFLQDGEPSDSFMARYWVPILSHGEPPIPHDDRISRGPLQGVTLTLLQMADPAKLVLYLTLPLVIVKFFWIDPIAFKSDQVKTVAAIGLASGSLQIDVAAAQLSSVLQQQDDRRMDGYKLVLDFYLQRLRPFDRIVAGLDPGKPVTWRGHNYLKRRDGLFKLPGDGVLAYGTTLDKLSGLLIDTKNHFYIYALSDLSIQSDYLLTSSELEVRTGADATPPKDEVTQFEVHGGESYRILQKDDGSFLVIAWHDRGGIKGGAIFFVIDPRQNFNFGAGAGGDGYSSSASFLNRQCTEIAIHGEDADYHAMLLPGSSGRIGWTAEKTSPLDEPDWMELSQTNDLAEPHPSIQRCLDLHHTVGGSPDREALEPLAFPQTVAEKTLWNVSPISGPARGKDSDAATVKFINETAESLAAQHDPAAGYFERIAGDCLDPSAICRGRFEKDRTLVYGVDTGTGGTFYHFCRQDAKPTPWKCESLSTPLTSIGEPALSPNAKWALVIGRIPERGFGFTVLDLQTLSEVAVLEMPRYPVQAGFSSDSRYFSVETFDHEAWIYSSEKFSKAPVRVPLGSLTQKERDPDADPDWWSSDAFKVVGNSLFTPYGSDAVAAFDLRSGVLQWVTRTPTFLSSEMELVLDDAGTIVVVHDRTHVELLSGLTGVPLTEAATLPADVFDYPSVSVGADRSVVMVSAKMKAIRTPPDALAHSRQIAGATEARTGIETRTGSTLITILPTQPAPISRE